MTNQRKLGHNQGRFGGSTVQQPARRPLLLTGMVVCGRCGRRMHGVYGGHRKTSGIYRCKGEMDKGQAACWSVLAEPIDRAVEQLFLETVVPDELSLSLAVEKQVDKQAEALAQQWRLRIEKAGYEARRAERRYKAVDPDNRVVARTLEREWEERLRELEQVERDYERAKSETRVHLTDCDRARIRELSRDLKALWDAPTTKPADRKAMLALVIEAIVLHPVDIPRRSTRVRVQWKAGAIDDLLVRRPSAGELRKPEPETLARLRQLASTGQHDADIAEQLNAEGHKRANGQNWTKQTVSKARCAEHIERVAPVRSGAVKGPEQLPDGSWSVAGAARRYQVSQTIVRGWVAKGLVVARRQAWMHHTSMVWLMIDEQTDVRLKAIVARKTRTYPES